MPAIAHRTIGITEGCIYFLVGLLLTAAAVAIAVGTAVEALDSFGASSPIETGVLVLDQILLLFIIAELLFTLRLTIARGEILTEPFCSSG